MNKKVIPQSEILWEFSRSGGPGGQNVNKVNTRVTLRFSVQDSNTLSSIEKEKILTRSHRLNRAGEIVISSEETRSQSRNREAAYALLLEHLGELLKERKVRKKTKPTRASKEKRLQAKTLHKRKKILRRRVSD